MEIKNSENSKVGMITIFSVAAVLFSTHAGGGFATGNQETQYFVTSGFSGIISAILAMILYTMTIREAIIMKNSRKLKNYKELFENLYHPFDKLEWIFEVYFHIMVGSSNSRGSIFNCSYKFNSLYSCGFLNKFNIFSFNYIWS